MKGAGSSPRQSDGCKPAAGIGRRAERRRCIVWFPVVALAWIGGFAVGSLPARQQTGAAGEEALDYYQKWLREDVVYIITPEERSVFEALTTPEEKETFIEQFWLRRDPDPSTPVNEFKEEHYRRLAYADEHFSSGLPGWMTDRGRVYIIHGPPDEIEKHPSGGRYSRPGHEGGGTTVTYPFEVWRYRHIEGIGDDVELEFVDPTMTGEYRLALRPEEKDALLHIPDAGLTLAEEMGLADKAQRPFFSSTRPENYPLMLVRPKDDPFTRYDTYSRVQRAPEIKYRDLQEAVRVNVSFYDLPLRLSESYFRLNDESVLVPVTVFLESKDLTFVPEGGRKVARLAVYGAVSSLANRLVTEFEDEVTVAADDKIPAARRPSAVYQRLVPLEGKLRYKLVLVVKDLNSQRVGIARKALNPPDFTGDSMRASSLLLAEDLELVEGVPNEPDRFVMGDVRVRPSFDGRFPRDSYLGLYFHLYNVSLDQTTLAPSLEITYRISDLNRPVLVIPDEQNASVHYASPSRIVIVQALSLKGLEPGRYMIDIHVKDRLTGQAVDLNAPFEIVEKGEAAGTLEAR